MPTQEERLAAVEQELIQLKKAHAEIASSLKIAEVTSETLIKQIGALRAETGYRFDRLSIHLDAQDAHLMYLHEKADKTDKTLEEVKTTLTQILGRLPEKSK